MNKVLIAIVTVGVAATLVYSTATPVTQCEGANFEELSERIRVEPCKKKQCPLTKGTNTTVHFRFKPKHTVKTLDNEVYAKIAGIPLPFLGVTGRSACAQVTRADTGEPAPCPLQPGVDYVYTNVFPIEQFYPQVPLTVHWSLNDGDDKVICFEVPATIVAGKKSAGK